MSEKEIEVPYMRQMRTVLERYVKWIPADNISEQRAVYFKNDSTANAERWVIQTTVKIKEWGVDPGINYYSVTSRYELPAVLEVTVEDPHMNIATVYRATVGFDTGCKTLIKTHLIWTERIAESFGVNV